ncbi:hypothetical protein P5G50_18505 [Leifsonia sp. F6_8S_P_1B]|uniref:Uncharacterized protein n=1 Tax=Leifsonia williamsii TaxID=3035919 RepID=A0ABT8KG49_9MICO|nr:hypothetical protein [Leifsonia williamsii]MDN4616444.1 hypothetical protein [Leifsonia williamsii]
MTDPMPTVRSLIDEARTHIETANSIGTSKPMTDYHLQLAQVKATLALAEQENIANLLAFIRIAMHEKSTITDQEGLQKLADRVVEGLGL